MIKRIPVAALRPGMFIHELDCGWLRHPFLRSQFRVSDEAQVRRIVDAGISELTIDTSRGDDLVEERRDDDAKPDVPERAPAPAASAGPDVEEQFREARRVHAEAHRLIRDLLSDVRLGRQISVERAEPVVERIADSILHHPGPLLALCRIKSKDEYTFQHSVGVSALMMLFCRAAGLPDAVREAGLGGLLHDMGKMTTPEQILNKPGKLTDEEFEVMRTHVSAGLDLLKETSGVTPTVRQVIGEHHERADGSGYPTRLKLADISRLGQMAAIVDVYDAITSDRVYHKGMSSPEAMKKLLEWSDHHFDPELVRTFIAAVGIYPIGTLVMLESGRLAVVAAHSDGQPLCPRVRVVYDTLKHAFVEPYDVDLARSTGHGGGDRILRHEPERKWSFNPLSYLGA